MTVEEQVWETKHHVNSDFCAPQSASRTGFLVFMLSYPSLLIRPSSLSVLSHVSSTLDWLDHVSIDIRGTSCQTSQVVCYRWSVDRRRGKGGLRIDWQRLCFLCVEYRVGQMTCRGLVTTLSSVARLEAAANLEKDLTNTELLAGLLSLWDTKVIIDLDAENWKQMVYARGGFS